MSDLLKRLTAAESVCRDWGFRDTQRTIFDAKARIAELEASLADSDEALQILGLKLAHAEGHSATALGGIGLIAAERQRQISAEGWTPEHDDEHINGEIAGAAACYAVSKQVRYLSVGIGWMEVWPTEWDFKPKDRMQDLIRAGALIAAEIDRLQRLAETKPESHSATALGGPTPVTDSAPATNSHD